MRRVFRATFICALLLAAYAWALVRIYDRLVEIRARYGDEKTLPYATTRARELVLPCRYGTARSMLAGGHVVILPPLDDAIGNVRACRVVRCLDAREVPVPPAPVIFVHGFNNTFIDAATFANRLEQDLKLSGRVLLFSWPAIGAARAYIADTHSATYSAAEFEKVLARLSSNGQQADLIVHSMGSQVVTSALERIALRQHDTVPRPVVRELILAAPDLDIDLLAQRLPVVRPFVKRITIYITARDRALALSRLLGEWPRAGQPSQKLFKLEGIDVIDVSQVEPKLLSGHHAYYRTNSRVLQDEFAILHHGADVSQRFGTTPRNAFGFRYWQLLPDA